ncbi:hypothetical protein M422DRAFT_257863 [Sphaerobolus stellatus SS14]|uniref:Uncharacterized protein n=1 Tax=Sphaerobolus stellatus (strain SS14) TaxID=990650 RepID=A0A0C9VND4_SPHS4|nr:hypothetical protein M422DRAFT_257863 [Sphaerobolus stellatus SS14]
MTVTEHLPVDAETYHGCPLVRLEEDPESLEDFLKALLGIIQLFDPEFEASDDPFIKALNILRLSHKYMTSRTLEGAVKWFRSITPEEFEEIPDKAPNNPLFWILHVHGCHFIKNSSKANSIPDPIELFIACGLYRLIPWTYYVMSCYKHIVVREQMKNGDSSLIRLSFNTTMTLIEGRGRMEVLYRKNIWKVINGYHGACKGGPCNDTLRLNWLQALSHESDMIRFDRQPYFLLGLKNNSHISLKYTMDGRLIRQPVPCESCSEHWLQESQRLLREA